MAAHDNHSESLQCLNYTTRPEEWVETQKGDFIGFFSPENGVFISHSHDVSNRGIQQMQRIERGFVETFNASELQVVGSHRGVINAYIGKD